MDGDDNTNRRKSITIFRRPPTSGGKEDAPSSHTGRRSLSYNVRPTAEELNSIAENNYGISVHKKDTLGKKISKFFKGKEKDGKVDHHQPNMVKSPVESKNTLPPVPVKSPPNNTRDSGTTTTVAAENASATTGAMMRDSSKVSNSDDVNDSTKAFPDRGRRDPVRQVSIRDPHSSKNISRESSGSSIFKPFNPSLSSGNLSTDNDSNEGSQIFRPYSSPLPILSTQDSDDEANMNAD